MVGADPALPPALAGSPRVLLVGLPESAPAEPVDGEADDAMSGAAAPPMDRRPRTLLWLAVNPTPGATTLEPLLLPNWPTWPLKPSCLEGIMGASVPKPFIAVELLRCWRNTGDEGPPPTPPPTDILRCGKLMSSTVLALRCRIEPGPMPKPAPAPDPRPDTPAAATPTPPTPPPPPPMPTNCCWPLLAGEPAATAAAATVPTPATPPTEPAPAAAAPGPPAGVIPTALPLRPRCTSSTLSKREKILAAVVAVFEVE
ncbi:uncharacterized protein [Drosophila bipectinata]|uniref:uncharacterized protein n=1 Tax=Drosophila bipectinata TaxID=42026 RepID=UPI001C8AD535|nr:formin-like protein 5 [Drosophila bipectinata]